MQNNVPQIAKTYTLGTAKQSLAVCIALKIPAVLWGTTGCGKSSLIRQIADELGVHLFDVRLSDKEPTDIGGIPVPDMATGAVRYLVGDLIPFVGVVLPDGTVIDDSFECILFLDEYDRCDKATENVSLQLTLDRCVNGRRLPAGCAVVCAGNGASDNGTTAISSAAATRLVHFYIEAESSEAIGIWDDWAETNAVSPAMRAYAKYCPAQLAPYQFLELQQYNPRTRVMADRLAQECDSLPFGEDVIEPLVFGCIGQVKGREYLAFRKLFLACPTADQVVADPKGTVLPSGSHAFGLMFALGRHLIHSNTSNGAEADKTRTKAFADYVARWPEEQQSHFYKVASEKLPSVIHTPAYKAWEKTARLS